MLEPDHIYLAGLVRKVQKNDSNAFAELYGLTYKRVYNYALCYLRDAYLAQDAVQEVYILVLKKIGQLNDATLFTAWLNQIGFHVCYDMCRHRSSDYGDITDPELLDILEDKNSDSNPENHAQNSDENSRLHESIDNLPANEKQVIVLRYFNELKIDDIAETMCISRSTAKRYLASGQEHLADMMNGKGCTACTGKGK
jgi:RNA polymerase sigma-70 factor (ECF subfamily)